MNRTKGTKQDQLESVARGEPIPRAAFRELIEDREALRQLKRMLMLRGLLRGEEASLHPGNLPQIDVDIEELAQYLRTGRLADPAREKVAERILQEYFPDCPDPTANDTALAAEAPTKLAPPASEVDTEIAGSADTDAETKLDDQDDADTPVTGGN